MKPHKILAVDDDPIVLSALTESLESQYNVFSATNGQDALTIMKTEDIALVISDQKMAGMTGVELMGRLARNYPDTIRAIVTGHIEDGILMNAINVGHIYAFVAKPWRVKELRAIIKKGIIHYKKTQALREPHLRTLLKCGVLSMEQLESVLHADGELEKSVEEILVEHGIVPASELKSAMRLTKIERKELREMLISQLKTPPDDNTHCLSEIPSTLTGEG